MADLTKQVIDQDGMTPTYAAASAGGDKIMPGERTFLHVKNGSGGALTVTLVTPKQVDGLAVADVAVSVGATSEKMIGPITNRLSGNPSDSSKCAITYSGVTTLTVACLDLES